MIKTDYKHLRFTRELLGEDIRYSMENNKTDHRLGTIFYFKPWRRWVLEPDRSIDVIFDAECLKDIAHFISQKGLV